MKKQSKTYYLGLTFSLLLGVALGLIIKIYIAEAPLSIQYYLENHLEFMLLLTKSIFTYSGVFAILFGAAFEFLSSKGKYKEYNCRSVERQEQRILRDEQRSIQEAQGNQRGKYKEYNRKKFE